MNMNITIRIKYDAEGNYRVMDGEDNDLHFEGGPDFISDDACTRTVTLELSLPEPIEPTVSVTVPEQPEDAPIVEVK